MKYSIALLLFIAGTFSRASLAETQDYAFELHETERLECLFITKEKHEVEILDEVCEPVVGGKDRRKKVSSDHGYVRIDIMYSCYGAYHGVNKPVDVALTYFDGRTKKAGTHVRTVFNGPTDRIRLLNDGLSISCRLYREERDPSWDEHGLSVYF